MRKPARAFDPEPWRSELRGFVLRMGAGQESEDVVQETFLRALRSPPEGRPRAWLYRVAMNVLRDRVRRGRHPGASDEEGASDALGALEDRAPDPRAAAIARETVRIAWRAAAGLPDRQRAALILRIQRHMDYDEIAVALECSIGAARQHFHLAVKAVRDALAEKGEHDG
ncbi:MAG: RNA polymerase sigma factor [Planctomycetota bacterium]